MHTYKLRKMIAMRLRELMARSQNLQTQNAVAKRTGLNQSTIGRILHEQVSATLDNVESIANAFNVDATELLTDNRSNTTLAEWERQIDKLPPIERDRVIQFIKFTIEQSRAALSKQTLNSITTSEPLPSAIESSALSAARRSVDTPGKLSSYEKTSGAAESNKPLQRESNQ